MVIQDWVTVCSCTCYFRWVRSLYRILPLLRESSTYGGLFFDFVILVPQNHLLATNFWWLVTEPSYFISYLWKLLWWNIKFYCCCSRRPISQVEKFHRRHCNIFSFLMFYQLQRLEWIRGAIHGWLVDVHLIVNPMRQCHNSLYEMISICPKSVLLSKVGQASSVHSLI